MREIPGGRNGGVVKCPGAGRRLRVKLPLPPGGGWLTADLNHTLLGAKWRVTMSVDISLSY